MMFVARASPIVLLLVMPLLLLLLMMQIMQDGEDGSSFIPACTVRIATHLAGVSHHLQHHSNSLLNVAATAKSFQVFAV